MLASSLTLIPSYPLFARSESEMAEQLRQQVLSDPHLMTQIRHSNPQLADAARASPQEFLRLFSDFRRQMSNAHAERERAELELAAADEFDIDAQRRIEEAIQQERIAESLEHAMEYTPEVFGSVTMLYVRTEVNGTEVKAFVDSGAQSTIMSPECAERCGIMRLLDKRFAGMAVGVGTAKILGRVHSAMIKLSPTQFLPCTFTIMEGKGVDCLFGLDMLKRYQACIDLRKGALVINGEELPFLAEHELPQSEREKELAQGEGGDKEMTEAGAAAGGGAAAASANKPPAAGGQTLGATPQARPGVEAPPPAAAAASATAAPGAMGPPSAPASASRGGASPPRPQEQSQQQQQQGGRTFPPASIKALTDLGASEAQAKALLEASGGNVEVAAGLLFHGQ